MDGLILCSGNERKKHAPIKHSYAHCPLCEAIESLHELRNDSFRLIAKSHEAIETLTTENTVLYTTHIIFRLMRAIDQMGVKTSVFKTIQFKSEKSIRQFFAKICMLIVLVIAGEKGIGQMLMQIYKDINATIESRSLDRSPNSPDTKPVTEPVTERSRGVEETL